MMRSSLKLCIDLIPETCSYKSLRRKMKRSQWDKLRKKVCADQGNVCCVCGAPGKLHCHESWSYDEVRRVQKLMGFHAVCGMCHHLRHFGLAQILGLEGHLDPEAVIEHFLKVNGVERADFEAHKTEAFRLWRERSQHVWHTDLGEWASLIERKSAGAGSKEQPPADPGE